MIRATWLFLALAACDNANPAVHQVFDVDAAWQMRCRGCSYPEHAFSGSIDTYDDPDRYVSCSLQGDKLHVSFDQPTIIDPQQPVRHGFGLTVSIGYDAATGSFDLARQCQILTSEEDDRGWGATCSDVGDCRLEPTLTGDSLAFTLRCAAMPSIPFQAGSEADLTGPGDPQAAISAQISPCSL